MQVVLSGELNREVSVAVGKVAYREHEFVRDAVKKMKEIKVDSV